MQLAAALADHSMVAPVLSFAGRTERPKVPPIPCRIGGFGGVGGLAAYLRDERTAAVVDATHPFAAQISANAVAACRAVRVPLGVLSRPPWQPVDGDHWIAAANIAAAAKALGDGRRNVFLAIGRQEVGAFRDLPHRFVIRSVDRPDAALLPRDVHLIQARGPFAEEAEIEALQRYAIDIVVSKNAGGAATYGKIAAARRLGLPVIMISRPRAPDAVTFTDVSAVVTWLETAAQDVHEAIR